MEYFFILVMFCVVMRAVLCDTWTRCPDQKASVNCSLENYKDCTKYYSRVNGRGLKWKIGSGYGLYVPGTDDERSLRYWTDLTSPPANITRNSCLSFYFRNDADTRDPWDFNFKVLLEEVTSKNIYVLRKYPPTLYKQWYLTQISLSDNHGSHRLIFSAKQHSKSHQGIGVRHVILSDTNCSIRHDNNYDVGDCDFEDPDWCGYQEMTSSRSSSLKWFQVMGDMLPTNAYSQSPLGYFLVVWGQELKVNPRKRHVKVKLRSPQIDIRQDGCLSLSYYNGRYHLENNHQHALKVAMETNKNGKAHLTPIYYFNATLGREWMNVTVPLPQGKYNLQFIANILLPFGESPYDVIAIDDVEIYQDSCDNVQSSVPRCLRKDLSLCGASRGTCYGNGFKHHHCLYNGYLGRYCQLER